jgi:hypothetical protein
MSRNSLDEIVSLIPNLSPEDQKFIMHRWITDLKNRRKAVGGQAQRDRDLIKALILIALQASEGGKGYDAKKAELWMESMFKKDLSQKPAKVAFAYVMVKRIDRRMVPFFTKVAQRVKNKINIRISNEVKRLSK